MWSRLWEAIVMNWRCSHHCVPRSVSSFPSRPPESIHHVCECWYLSGSQSFGAGITVKQKKGFLPKWAVTDFLWLTLNRFSLDDSWTWTGGASLPEAQRPWAACHAQAKSLSLGHVAFLLGSSTLDKPDSHDLFMLYLPSLINLSQTGQALGDRHLFFPTYKHLSTERHKVNFNTSSI